MDWGTFTSTLAGVAVGAGLTATYDYLKERRASWERLRRDRVDLYRQILGILVMTRTDMEDLSAADHPRFEETFSRLERNVKWAVDLAVALDVPQPLSVGIEVLYETLIAVDLAPAGSERLKAVLRLYKAEDDIVQACRRTLVTGEGQQRAARRLKHPIRPFVRSIRSRLYGRERPRAK